MWFCFMYLSCPQPQLHWKLWHIPIHISNFLLWLIQEDLAKVYLKVTLLELNIMMAGSASQNVNFTAQVPPVYKSLKMMF